MLPCSSTIVVHSFYSKYDILELCRFINFLGINLFNSEMHLREREFALIISTSSYVNSRQVHGARLEDKGYCLLQEVVVPFAI